MPLLGLELQLINHNKYEKCTYFVSDNDAHFL